jgi:predicted acyl esterase
MTKTFLVWVSVLLIACFIPSVSISQELEYEYSLGVKIPMRDGINLSAFIWKPSGMTEPMPAIVVLTPYGAEKQHGDGKYFVENGFVVVAVDTRGRGNSILSRTTAPTDTTSSSGRPPNPGVTGRSGNVSKESAKDARTAIVTLYHDEAHPGRIELPVRK